MNSLNLRVSSVRTGENVKRNAEMRAALVTLPKQYELSEELYCAELRRANTVPEQVNVVKNIFKNIDISSDTQALQFLTDLCFFCPLKHPVRNQILKLLVSATRLSTGGIDESSIVGALVGTLQKIVEEGKSETESVKWNRTITSLSGCFDNFECGLKALNQCISVVFPFLCTSLQKYITELGVLSSPSVRNEYYLYVHNSIRLMLCCVQEFGDQLKVAHLDQLKQLNGNCKEIVLDSEMPMDPRTNAGILMAHITKLFDGYEAFIAQVKLTKNPNEITLCVGIINTCDQHDFQQYSVDIRDICSKIEEIANANATVPNILLVAARALYQISKLVLSFAIRSPHTMDDVKLILRKLLIFTVGYLEHHMDSVRHICRDIIRNIVAAARKIQFDFLLQKIYDACNSDRLSLSMKCVVLQQVATILGAEEITRNCPQLFSELFAVHLGRDFMVNNLFDCLMIYSHKELSYEAWLKMWIIYLLEIASVHDDRLPDIEVLIVKAVKCEPRIVPHIITRPKNSKIPISTKLSALWAVRKSGIKMDNFQDIMQQFSRSLQLSILSNCDERRLMALRLLVETHKTTEMLTMLECEHLLTYLEYNANGQSPATRQKSLSLFSKALVRCELNLVKLLKGKRPPTSLAAQPLQLKFLQDIMRILVSNIFPGANFSRRFMSLQLLEQCLRIGINCNLKLATLLPKTTIPSLAATLSDSYEANKELAVNMLKLLEDNAELSLIEQHALKINLPRIQALLTSVRPTDSVTAAYQLEFYCNRALPKAFGDYDEPTYNSTYYAALRWLLLELKAGLKTAKQSILQAAKYNPLYGMLFAIKHLIKRLDFITLSEDISWRILFAELILVCKELTTVVAPVVNSSSPEGFLPNDFGQFPTDYGIEPDPEEPQQNCKILSSKSSKIDLSTVRTTPQMVLLCAWRTVKEVSLILGEIVMCSPIQYNKLTECFLVTKEQLLEIGEHFKLLLSETKHRGAFEQAYIGFSKLCCRLWRVESSDLNSLPMLWLRELITLISRDEQVNEKICATRRSAGVPFMVQALITSELQLGSTKSLYYCMSHLFQLCASREHSTESRTHALNILRALFRCTDLNEAVCDFVAEGVMCAVRSYDAPNWSEKNSATLLFAALITRIFGVQRTRDPDNLSVRNKMTGRVFFLRYPRLYDFFLEELQAASVLVMQQQKAPRLQPLLLICSRLYPSALEGTESNLKLAEFIPYIVNCAGCAEMQTRYLAAKAVVALISKDQVTVMILRKCAEIVLLAGQAPPINLNVLHGNLLQIYYLIKYHKSLVSKELIGDISCTLVSFHERTRLKNAVILKTMLDIFIEILNSLSSLNFDHTVIQQLLYFSMVQELNAPNTGFAYPVLHKSNFIYNLHILRLTLPFGALSDYTLSPPIARLPLEQAETCLNVMLLLLLRANPKNSPPTCDDFENDDIIAEFEVSPAELQFVRILSVDTLNELATEIRQSKALQQTLKEVVQMPLFYPGCVMKSYAVLSLLDHFDFTLTQLIKESKKHPGDVKSPLALCVERFILQHGIDYKSSQFCLEYLTEISQPWQPDCLRAKAASILVHIAGHFPKALERKRMAFIRSYISLMLALLMDDDYYIRDYSAKIVLDNLPEHTEMETVVATMAQRLFLQAMADILVNLKSDDNYILEIFKVITETLTQASCSADNDGDSLGGSSQHSSLSNIDEVEVFDKNEANAFAEPLKAITDAVVVFRNTFKRRPKVLRFIDNFMHNLKLEGSSL